MTVHRQLPNEIKYIALPGPMINPDGRKYWLCLLPSSFVARASNTNQDRWVAQIAIEGIQGALRAPSLPTLPGKDLAVEVFKIVVDQATGFAKEQAAKALGDKLGGNEVLDAMGFMTNRTGGMPMTVGLLYAAGGGKAAQYHNRVQAEAWYNKPHFFSGKPTKLKITYGLPLPVVGGSAEVEVIGA
jgi:hypothetical protein